MRHYFNGSIELQCRVFKVMIVTMDKYRKSYIDIASTRGSYDYDEI